MCCALTASRQEGGGACKAAVERMTQGLAAEVSADKYEGGIAVSC